MDQSSGVKCWNIGIKQDKQSGDSEWILSQVQTYPNSHSWPVGIDEKYALLPPAHQWHASKISYPIW